MDSINVKRVVTFIAAVSMLGLVYTIGLHIGREPRVIYEASDQDPDVQQWQRDWTQARDTIVTATVVTQSSDNMYVYLDYIYSGSHGDEATSCGNVTREGRGGEWVCSPVSVKRGRGFITLRFGLSDSAREAECSDAIVVDFYDKNGATFFSKSFTLEKTWVKKPKGLYQMLREIVGLCPASG